MTPASGASSASWGSSAWLVSCAGTKRDRLPWPIDPIVDRRACTPLCLPTSLLTCGVSVTNSRLHAGVKPASRPPGITDVLTRALYRYAVRVRAEPRCSEQGRGNGLHAVGNIAALIPRAARVRALKALVWASRVKAATLDQRSCDPGHGRTIPMCGAKGVLSSGSCLRVSCGEVSGRCSAHLLHPWRPCRSFGAVGRQPKNSPGSPHAPPPTLDLSGGAHGRGQNDVVSILMPPSTAGRVCQPSHAAPDRQTRR